MNNTSQGITENLLWLNDVKQIKHDNSFGLLGHKKISEVANKKPQIVKLSNEIILLELPKGIVVSGLQETLHFHWQIDQITILSFQYFWLEILPSFQIYLAILNGWYWLMKMDHFSCTTWDKVKIWTCPKGAEVHYK